MNPDQMLHLFYPCSLVEAFGIVERGSIVSPVERQAEHIRALYPKEKDDLPKRLGGKSLERFCLETVLERFPSGEDFRATGIVFYTKEKPAKDRVQRFAHPDMGGVIFEFHQDGQSIGFMKRLRGAEILASSPFPLERMRKVWTIDVGSNDWVCLRDSCRDYLKDLNDFK